MRGERLSLGLLLMAFGLVAGVPVLRAGFVSVVQELVPGGNARSIPGAASLEAVARAHPDDAQMWLAYAATADSLITSVQALTELGETGDAGQGEPPSDVAAEEAWARALALGGSSPATLLQAARHHMADAGQVPGNAPGEAPPSAAELAYQALNRAKARDLLLRCRALAPRNAAPYYALAWTYLADGNRPQALEALRSASLERHWDTYEPQLGAAMLRLLGETRTPPGLRGIAAQALVAHATFPPLAHLRSLARAVVAMGDSARERGDHAEALACYGSMLHLGHLMRANARTIIQGLVGIAVSAIGTDSVLPKADVGRAVSEARGDEERARLRAEARAAAFAAYARQHGREDLARLCTDEMVAGMQWKADARAVSGRMTNDMVQQMTRRGALHAAAVGLTAAALLCVALIAGLWSLVLRYWREPRLPAPCGYLGWLGLLVALVVPGQVVAAVFTWIIGERERGEPSYPEPGVWALMASGLLLWLLIVLVLALRRRARLPLEARPGKFRSYLGALRALLPPTLAALLLFSALGLGPVQANLRAMENQQRAILQQGEVQYYGIGTGKVSSPPADN